MSVMMFTFVAFALSFQQGNSDGLLVRFTAPINHMAVNNANTSLAAASRYGSSCCVLKSLCKFDSAVISSCC